MIVKEMNKNLIMIDVLLGMLTAVVYSRKALAYTKISILIQDLKSIITDLKILTNIKLFKLNILYNKIMKKNIANSPYFCTIDMEQSNTRFPSISKTTKAYLNKLLID